MIIAKLWYRSHSKPKGYDDDIKKGLLDQWYALCAKEGLNPLSDEEN